MTKHNAFPYSLINLSNPHKILIIIKQKIFDTFLVLFNNMNIYRYFFNMIIEFVSVRFFIGINEGGSKDY